METQSRIKHGEGGNNADTETTSAVKETAQVTWCAAQHAVCPFQVCETGSESAFDFRQARLLADSDWRHGVATLSLSSTCSPSTLCLP